MAWKGGGKGGGSTFLQKALQGAVVSALGLAEFSDKGRGKGKGKHDAQENSKGAGKGAGKAAAAGGDPYQCRWSDCAAAQKRSATWGDRRACHCCLRPKGQALNPPLQSMAEWAFKEKLANAAKGDREKVLADAGAEKGGKAGGKGKAKAAEPPSKNAEELRQDRLAALKAAQVGAPPPEKAVQAKAEAGEKSPMQALAALFVGKEKDGAERKTAAISAEIRGEAEKLTEKAKAVVASVEAETYPLQREFKTPKETLNILLESSEPFAAEDEYAVAEKALAASKLALTTLKDAGMSEDDAVLVGLQAKVVKQEASLAKLQKKVPSSGRRRQALSAAKEAFKDKMKAQDDNAKACESKAMERTLKRRELIDEIESTLDRLRLEENQAVIDLDVQHTKRGQERRAFGEAVIALIDEKLEEEDHVPDVIFQDAVESPEAATETERALDAALNESKTHQAAASAAASQMMEEITRLQLQLAAQQEVDEAAAAESAKNQADAEAVAKAAAEHASAQMQARLAAVEAEAAAAAATRAREETIARQFEAVSVHADPDTLDVIDVESLKENNQLLLKAAGNLFFILNRWRQLGAAVCFSFDDLVKHTLAGKEAPRLMKTLLGLQWKLWFEPDPDHDTVIPRQAALCLLATLERAKNDFEVSEESKKTAQESFTVIAESSKKRRIG